MPEFWKPLASNGTSVAPDLVLIRMIAAVVLGLVVALIYRRVRRAADVSASLSVTLVLLCALIAMVSQVVGDNVARAFSLVGALSIVRFRTVVKDTQDTAYVIFAVVVGMAAGTSDLWVALIGIVVVGAAAFAMRSFFHAEAPDAPEYLLRLRIPPGHDLQAIFKASLAPHLKDPELVSLGTAKGGAFVEVTYRTRIPEGATLTSTLATISAAPGVEDLQLRRTNGDE